MKTNTLKFNELIPGHDAIVVPFAVATTSLKGSTSPTPSSQPMCSTGTLQRRALLQLRLINLLWENLDGPEDQIPSCQWSMQADRREGWPQARTIKGHSISRRWGSRSFTASLVTLWQSLCGVIRLKREVDAWDQQRCLALIPYPEEVSDFRGFRPVSALLPRVCRLKVPSWTAVWSLEWSAASSFEAGDTCSKEPIILLLPISDISGVCTCKFIVFGPFWFQLRFSREKSSTENIWGVWTHIRTREFFAYNLTNSEPWGNKVNQIEFPLFWDVIKLVKLERPHTTKSPPNVAEEGKFPPYFWDEI